MFVIKVGKSRHLDNIIEVDFFTRRKKKFQWTLKLAIELSFETISPPHRHISACLTMAQNRTRIVIGRRHVLVIRAPVIEY